MQRFYRTSDGQWLEATATTTADDWSDDGSAKARALAEALGVRRVDVVDLRDGLPDPREGELLKLPAAETPPPPPPDRVQELAAVVDGLRARMTSVESRLDSLPVAEPVEEVIG